MGAINSRQNKVQGLVKVMYGKYGSKAIQFLPEWLKNLEFPQGGKKV